MIMFVSSSGGHYAELRKISLTNDPQNIIISEKTPLTLREKLDEYLIYGSRDNMLTYPFIFLINSIKAYIYLKKYQPQIIVSTGAHSCVPFFYLGHKMGITTIYIESFAKVNTPSLTYQLIKKYCDYVIVQHQELTSIYENSLYFGGVY